jgi:hypothetical protein
MLDEEIDGLLNHQNFTRSVAGGPAVVYGWADRLFVNLGIDDGKATLPAGEERGHDVRKVLAVDTSAWTS